MTDLILIAATLLAEDGGPRQTGPDFGKASPVGLLVLIVLLVGTFALVFSMNRHLKRLPESFDPDHPEPDQAVDEGTTNEFKGDAKG
ncbi:hypothetical protein ACTJJE_23440 [Mycolicibacterium sp. 22603]|uniref:hypothetical protein n=1 Tax=Mycolicibacterium TaxID=1866885 RepID=UPI002FFABF83